MQRVFGGSECVEESFADGGRSGWLNPDFRGGGVTFAAAFFQIQGNFVNVTAADRNGV
ncbi:hypothetical protein LBMAG46_17610 [Planctomycetia bacterium]|nr:hypothetical protein LBMAG46_17610 [Planctomycetia bacterium]